MSSESSTIYAPMGTGFVFNLNKWGEVIFSGSLIVFTFFLIYLRNQNVNTFLALANIVEFLWIVTLFVFIIYRKDSINSSSFLSFLDVKYRLPVALAVGLVILKILIYAVIRSQSAEFYEDEEKYEDKEVKEPFNTKRQGIKGDFCPWWSNCQCRNFLGFCI